MNLICNTLKYENFIHFAVGNFLCDVFKLHLFLILSGLPIVKTIYPVQKKIRFFILVFFQERVISTVFLLLETLLISYLYLEGVAPPMV
jgi:hypothetical protein